MHPSNNETSTTLQEPTLHYLVREPKVKASTRKAIILLHGVGSNEQDLFSLANQLPGDFYIISARGPIALGNGRYAWYEVDFSTGRPAINAPQELSSRAAIKNFIARVKQMYDIDEIYLGGFSQGAIMSFSVGLTDPEGIQGIIAFSGRILDSKQLPTPDKEHVRNLKVFLAHGVYDSKLPVHYAREARQYLESLQIPLSYHEYNMDHQITEPVLQDVNAWLASVSRP